jgi:hypothetical protein
MNEWMQSLLGRWMRRNHPEAYLYLIENRKMYDVDWVQSIGGMILWASTDQGHQYWSNIQSDWEQYVILQHS